MRSDVFMRRILIAVMLSSLTGAALCPAQSLSVPDGASDDARRPRIVIARDARAVRFYEPQTDRVTRMIERGVMALSGERDVASAWRRFVRPGDIVGIKINTAPGPAIGSHRAVVDAIVAGLRKAGVPASHIIIWDRSAYNMVAAGWEIREQGEGPGPYCYATLPYAEWDETTFYSTPHVGTIIWGDHEFGTRDVSERSYYSQIVARAVTKIINVPTLLDSRHVGLAGCLHNLAIGSVDNNRRFQTESLHYDAGIAEICARPPIRGKLALNIMDALVAQYAGGPQFQPQAAWTPGEIYFSRDPVAIDALALAAIEQKRKAAKMPDLSERSRHVRYAEELGVGIADRRKMDIVELNP